MRYLTTIFALAGLLTISGCVTVDPLTPRIERLPDGVAGPFVPAIARPLSLAEVADMARGNAPANVIIQSLRDSRATYAISTAEANDLARQGVPYEVIEYLRHGELRTAPLVTHPYPYPYSYPSPHSHSHSYPYPYPYSYSAYVPYLVLPGIYYSRWGFGRYPRFAAPGISLRFGFRR